MELTLRNCSMSSASSRALSNSLLMVKLSFSGGTSLFHVIPRLAPIFGDLLHGWPKVEGRC